MASNPDIIFIPRIDGVTILDHHCKVPSRQISMPKVKLSLLESKTFIYEIDVATRWAKWHL
jgi:hypothetical protein